jgi:hypothetical protein
MERLDSLLRRTRPADLRHAAGNFGGGQFLRDDSDAGAAFFVVGWLLSKDDPEKKR